MRGVKAKGRRKAKKEGKAGRGWKRERKRERVRVHGSVHFWGRRGKINKK